MWKANGKTTTLQLFLDSLSPKTETLSLEETMDLSRDRLILELETVTRPGCSQMDLMLLSGTRSSGKKRERGRNQKRRYK
jgi:hypothetical protein